MPYNLYSIASQKYCNFLALFLIISTSTQNTAQRTPFNPETLDYCPVGCLLSNKPVCSTLSKPGWHPYGNQKIKWTSP